MPPRKPIADLIEELKSWLPNYGHGPADYPTLLWRVLASIPGGDEAEDMGYEPFQLGWHEADQLGRVLVAIQDKRDVEDLIAGLIHDEEQVEEAPRRNPVARANPMAAAHPSNAREVRTPRAGRSMPNENVFWRSIPPGSRVALVGHSYVVTLPDGRRASAYWGGNDAAEAQRYLDSLVRRDTKPMPSRPERRPPARRR